ncbi:hypothetical protein K435DRAFT_755135 [Dendrothele bispora CBS 962.96]|uniref:Uncharacterized protein n=1 Tax=Dendrothele bispora (strain CBS 962.96) TaxID=1314807 RepID=A0A4S8M226_DENBC|nr:hypothetical protein K435DRAFT_755135 [Dendrothele bispora CBS 962.96]
MAPRPPRFLEDQYDAYPDNQELKTVYFQAEGLSYTGGDRHVLLWWYNDFQPGSAPVIQIVQLTGQGGNYQYYAPVANTRDLQTLMKRHLQVELGMYSRADRDKILTLADSVVFSKSSVTNGCRVWTRDLLSAMVSSGLLDLSIFRQIVEQVPLPERVAEQ